MANKKDLKSSMAAGITGGLDSLIQLSITADALEFINTGKREGTTSEADGQAAAADNAPVPPADMPQDGEEDLPF